MNVLALCLLLALIALYLSYFLRRKRIKARSNGATENKNQTLVTTHPALLMFNDDTLMRFEPYLYGGRKWATDGYTGLEDALLAMGKDVVAKRSFITPKSELIIRSVADDYGLVVKEIATSSNLNDHLRLFVFASLESDPGATAAVVIPTHLMECENVLTERTSTQEKTPYSLEFNSWASMLYEDARHLSDYVITECDIHQRVRSVVITDQGKVYVSSDQYWHYLHNNHVANREREYLAVGIGVFGSLVPFLLRTETVEMITSEHSVGTHVGHRAFVVPVTERQYNMLIEPGNGQEDRAIHFLNQERKRFYNRNKKFMETIDDWVRRYPHYELELLFSSGGAQLDASIPSSRIKWAENILSNLFDNELLASYDAGGKSPSEYPLVQILSVYEQDDGRLEINLVINYTTNFFFYLAPKSDA